MDSLGELVAEGILPRLSSRDVAAFGCVSGRCRVSASDDALWRKLCSRDLDLDLPLAPDGAACSSFKEAYRSWQESFGTYPWDLVRRAQKCWADIRSWASANLPEAANTLLKGASEEEINQVEVELGVKLPLPTRVLYRFCSGQDTFLNGSFEDSSRSIFGIIGGYMFYDHVVNVHLLPLSLIVEETRKCAVELADSWRPGCIVVALSCFVEKIFLLDCFSGDLYVGTKNFVEKGEMMPCVPRHLVRLGNYTEDNIQDAMLLWLEEHARRLQNGHIQNRPLTKHLRAISLFPELPPPCSVAITNGVKIRASALFIPELSDLNSGERDKYFFSYSIGMSLLQEGGFLDGAHFSSCQLQSRHWIIRANDTVVSDVCGEAVIGKYPLLSPNGPEFVYESCSPMPAYPGSIEGSFTFVPGSLKAPRGRPFEVQVAPFILEVPGYIF